MENPPIRALGVCLAVAAWVAPFARAEMTHRWSFNAPAGNAPAGTVVADRAGGAAALVKGNFSRFTGTALRLQGSGGSANTTTGDRSAGFISGYVDLPNGIISAKPNLSVEIWATPLSGRNYERVFEFGRTNLSTGFGPGSAPGEINDVNTTGSTPGATEGSDSILLSFAVDNDLGRQRSEARLNGANIAGTDTALPTTAGVEYHYVVTFQDGAGAFGSGGGQMKWYRNGALAATSDVGFHLSEIEDVNIWLGRSLWTADYNAHALFDEVRLYDHVLTQAEISADFAAGPDAVSAPPPAADHVWAFTEQAASQVDSGRAFPDSVGGMPVVLRGNGGSLTGTAVRLPGSTNGNQPAGTISAYLDLPNGIVSARPEITFEAWATPLASKDYQRLFDFGRATATAGDGAQPGEIIDGGSNPGNFAGYDNLMLSLNVGGNLGTQRLEGQIGNGPAIFTDSTAATAAGTQYQYVLTVKDGAGSFGEAGCQAKWFRNGVLQNSLDLGFHLTAMADVNNWIGRSQYAGDSNSALSLNELRIYNRSLSQAEILASYAAGPDPASGPPEPPVPAPLPLNRWKFNTNAGSAASGKTFTDIVSGEIATVRGNGGQLDGSQLTLPGTTNGNQTAANISAYLDLPNGIVSSKTSVSFEAWVTPLSSKNWQRIFDFGNSSATSGPAAASGEIVDSGSAPGNTSAYDDLFLSWNVGGTLGVQRLEAKLAGGDSLAVESDLSSATVAGVEHHIVLAVEDGAGSYGTGGCQSKWYRDGLLQGTVDLNFHLRDIADVNNWIGRSQWTPDSNANMAINELRIYDHALSAAEVTATLAAGPDADFPPPVAVNDSATINLGGKVLVDVLANDTGLIDRQTLEIVSPPATGTAVVQPSGKILYSHSGIGGEPDSFTYRVSGESGPSAPATVSITISASLRIANTSLNVPATPPPTAVQVVLAYPGVTFNKPLCFVTPPGDPKRLFVCEISGKLKVIPDVTATAPTSSVVLDMAQVVANPPRNPLETLKPGRNPECGLLGLAFHPDFAANGFLYVAYSVGKADDPAVWFQRLSRFTIPQAQIGSPNPVADPASELILLEQRDRDDNHNGGDLHFGADGYLYWSLGDEANPNDYRKNSQRIDMNFFGGLLRLDVDKKPGNPEPNAHPNPTAVGLGYSATDGIPRDEIPAGSGDFRARYSIPLDNPFVSSSQGGTWDGTFNGTAIPASALQFIRSEFYAVGLRSPWRFFIDPVTQEIWVGDVGQDAYEELNLVTKGGNYGWAFYEGFHAGPKTPPAGFTSVPPIWEYPHGTSSYAGKSIIGGVVYHGTRFSSLTGAYIFGDNVSGNIWALTRPGGQVHVERIAGQPYLTTFGTDPSNGDVLVSDYNGGRIMRVITTTPAAGFPTTLAATGLFSDLTDLSPAPGVIPYEPNLRFWSDYAVKRRWFAIPDGVGRMTWSRDEPWTFPGGEIWIKHFDLETERGNPASPKKRIETRVLVKNDSGTYGVSYRWNAAGTEATLAADGGEDFPVEINVDGAPHTQQWHIPSRSQCVACHSPQAGYALSFNTRQLNRINTIGGLTGNQIDLLHSQGFLANTPENPAFLPRHLRPDETQFPLEERVRSYLAVNCAYCHAGAGGTAAVAWDGLSQITLEETGLIGGHSGLAGDPYKLVVPGDPAHSVVLQRMAASGGFTRMPPIATSEIDPEGVALVSEWIADFSAASRFYSDWRLEIFGSASSPEGAPDADSDGDGMTNRAEFLAGTDPRNGASFLVPGLTKSGDQISLDFTLPANRSVQVETSGNLTDWSIWDAPLNHGMALPAGPTTVTGPAEGMSQYFRLHLEER